MREGGEVSDEGRRAATEWREGKEVMESGGDWGNAEGKKEKGVMEGGWRGGSNARDRQGNGGMEGRGCHWWVLIVDG